MTGPTSELSSRNPTLATLLEAAGVVIMLVDRQRQILFANTDLLRAVGLESAEALIGARPGEALRCLHAVDGPEGCGTTLHCQSCGVNQAILASQSKEKSSERECLLAVEREGRHVALEYMVKASPVAIDGEPMTVVSFRDITADKRRDALEQVFFHDILNTVTSLKGNVYLLRKEPEGMFDQIVERMDYLSQRLHREIVDQRSLRDAEAGTLELRLRPTSPDQILTATENTFAGQLARSEKTLEVTNDCSAPGLITDLGLLVRVITNMVKNALEASARGGTVKLWVEDDESGCAFRVHNEGVIPDLIARQIFMRSFSTKQGRGRGLGTYSMKLLGEQYLGGKVSFSTSETEGTIFSITLPLELPRI